MSPDTDFELWRDEATVRILEEILPRVDKRKAYPYPGNRHGRGPGKRRALPLTGAALERWFTPLTQSQRRMNREQAHN